MTVTQLLLVQFAILAVQAWLLFGRSTWPDWLKLTMMASLCAVSFGIAVLIEGMP